MFKVTLLNLNYKFDEKIVVGENDPINDPKNVPKNGYEKVLIEAIKKNSTITRKEFALLIGKTVKTVQRTIDNSDKIFHAGPKNGGHWEKID